MRWTCIQTASLVGARTLDLRTAQRLALEDHWTGCVPCREAAQLGNAFREMLEAQPVPATPSSIDRTITRALRQLKTEEPVRETPRAMPRGLAVGALAIVIGGAVALWPDSKPAPSKPAAASIVSIPAKELTQLSHAVVTLDGEGTWLAESSTVVLHRGSVDVAVDPAPRRPFSVQTSDFLVEVRGTRFHVSADGVDVFEGRVRVRGLDGTVRVESLGPGEHWRLREPAPVAAVEPPPPSPPSAPMVVAKPISVATHLARAGSHLANKDVGLARREIEAALASTPTRAQRATAAVLAADTSFVEGDSEKAIALYLEAHEQFSDVLAGENALFAAARLQVKTGPTTKATELLERYLARYPKGQFRGEATTRLRELTR